MTSTPTIKNLGPLDWRIGIVDKAGRPTQEFQRRWQSQIGNNSQIGIITTGTGAPTTTPTQDGEVYVDTGATPEALYVSSGGSWSIVGVVDFTQLADVPHNYTSAGNKLVRVNSGATGLEFDSVSNTIDLLGNTEGDVLYRGASAWTVLSPGTSGQVLTTGGAGADPSWQTPSTGTGTVSSVGLSLPTIFTITVSPITTTGDLTAVLATQNANIVLAGPGSGSAAAPTFRSLVASDLPLFSSSDAGVVPSSGGGTTNFLRADGTWDAPSGGGGGDPNYTHSAGAPSGAGTEGLVNTDITNGDLYIATVSPGSGSATVVQSAYGDGHNVNPTPILASAPTVGNLIIGLYVSDSGVPNPGVNGWTYLNSNTNASANLGIYYRYVQSGDGTTYVTMGNGSTYMAALMWEVTGISGTIGTDIVLTQMDAYTSGSSTPITTQTTTASNQLALVGGFEWTIFGPTPSIGSPFTQDVASAGFADGGVGGHNAYPTSGSSVNVTVNWGGTPGAGASIATILVQGSSGSTITTWHEIQKMDEVFTSSDNGVVPASGGGTTNFLRADGTWNVPSGGGGGGTTFVPPVLASFTQLNNPSSSTSTSLPSSAGVQLTAVSNSGGFNLNAWLETAPSAPYTMWTRLSHNQSPQSQYCNLGMILGDGSGKLIAWTFFTGGGSNNLGEMTVETYNSVTSRNSFTGDIPQSVVMPNCIGINDDGTNLNFLISYDGVSSFSMLQVSRTAWLSNPNQIGFYVNGYSRPVAGNFVHWATNLPGPM